MIMFYYISMTFPMACIKGEYYNNEENIENYHWEIFKLNYKNSKNTLFIFGKGEISFPLQNKGELLFWKKNHIWLNLAQGDLWRFF